MALKWRSFASRWRQTTCKLLRLLELLLLPLNLEGELVMLDLRHLQRLLHARRLGFLLFYLLVLHRNLLQLVRHFHLVLSFQRGVGIMSIQVIINATMSV